MLITIIGRGHSGTRAISNTLKDSGVYMGEPLNASYDLIPPQDMYEAARVFSSYVSYKGNLEWDFSRVLDGPIDPKFKQLIENYLHTVLSSKAAYRGWKIPETTLVYPWIKRMFPEIFYIYWVRDPRDCILNSHVTDDLSFFNVPYDHTDNLRLRRAISWKYQREIVKATPRPRFWHTVRFEDMVMEQEKTLKSLEGYLGIPLARIEMRPESVGRYKTAEGEYMFDFFKEDMDECGYEH